MTPETLHVDDRTYLVRPATRDDVGAIVELLADDVLGSKREADDADLAPYLSAFERIASHPNQELIVVERDNVVVGTFDITILASLSRQGALRAQIEAVRVSRSERGTGLGASLFQWIIAHARTRGCTLLQLTTDRTRENAHRFYERLGFSPSHIGYKLDLGAGS